jgi:hypothetical protein
MYACDFYQTLSVKGGYKGSSSVYITYERESYTKSVLLSLSRYTIISEFTKLVNSVFMKVAIFLHICEI